MNDLDHVDGHPIRVEYRRTSPVTGLAHVRVFPTGRRLLTVDRLPVAYKPAGSTTWTYCQGVTRITVTDRKETVW